MVTTAMNFALLSLSPLQKWIFLVFLALQCVSLVATRRSETMTAPDSSCLGSADFPKRLVRTSTCCMELGRGQDCCYILDDLITIIMMDYDVHEHSSLLAYHPQELYSHLHFYHNLILYRYHIRVLNARSIAACFTITRIPILLPFHSTLFVFLFVYTSVAVLSTNRIHFRSHTSYIFASSVLVSPG
jgi:hypothetical protein